ncbi:MAG: FHA domain-containing protein [Kiritimatiellae bacterium]|nr:FHA domain-containing protein [Kiritimatiellia bacterium]
MSAPKRQLLIRLEYCGECVRESSFADLPLETRVGRAPDCFWRIPDADRSVSARHAIIRKKGRKGLVISDTDSRNGIYFKGVAVKERKLAPGDSVGIGDAKIVVEMVEARDSSAAKFHTIEQLSGEDKDRTIPLEKPITRIGSGRECEVRIADSLVSHVHAIFEVRADGYCYVKDNASRNGIKVNGVRQNEEAALTGQMLKDGDIVSVAYVDFRFWDKNVQHVRANLPQKILIVAATLAIALGGYFGVQTFFPSAKSLRLAAERMAAAGDFERAASLAQESAEARGAELDATQRGDFIRKLALWKHTAAEWASIRAALAGKEVNLWQVNRRFASLISSDNENWKWNTSDALAEMKRAKVTQAMLTRLLSGVERLERIDSDVSAFTGLAAEAESLLSAGTDIQPYQQQIRSQLADMVAEMRRVVGESEKIAEIMSDFKSVSDTDRTADAVTAVAALAAKRSDERKQAGLPASPAITRACHLLSVPLEALRASLRILEKNYRAVAEVDFAAYAETLPLPSADECMVSPIVSTRRADLLSENVLLGKAIVQLRSFRQYLVSEKVLDGKGVPPTLEALFSERIRTEALSCDCFASPPPGYSVKTPTSSYDRLLGVNVFYQYLSTLDGDFDTSVFDERFTPDVFKAVETFKTISQFVAFCNANGRTPYAPLMRKALAVKSEKARLVGDLSQARSLLSRRDALIKEMDALFKSEQKSRRGVIAGGLAYCLRDGSLPMEEDESVRKTITDALKAVRRKTSDVMRVPDGRGPEARIAAERMVLGVAIPGDPLVRQPWADQAKGAGR